MNLEILYQRMASGLPVADPANGMGLQRDLEQDVIQRGHEVYRGKVRDLILSRSEILLIHSDRLTAFDRLLGVLPYKGLILNEINDYWMKELSDLGTHRLEKVHSRILRVRRLRPLRVEVVVRGFLAGNLLRAYERGERQYCGVALPEGLRPYGPLEHPIITPTTKAAAFAHDENTSEDQILTQGLATRNQWHQVIELAREIYRRGCVRMKQLGWILGDAKYEFGLDDHGKVWIMDEVHTPDSSRLWESATFEDHLARGLAPVMLDKEIVRQYLLGQGFSGVGAVPVVPESVLAQLGASYLRILAALSGRILDSETDDPPMAELIRTF